MQKSLEVQTCREHTRGRKDHECPWAQAPRFTTRHFRTLPNRRSSVSTPFPNTHTHCQSRALARRTAVSMPMLRTQLWRVATIITCLIIPCPLLPAFTTAHAAHTHTPTAASPFHHPLRLPLRSLVDFHRPRLVFRRATRTTYPPWLSSESTR